MIPQKLQEYCTLQFRLINRHLSDFGLHPVAGYLLLSFIFISCSLYLFYSIEYAPFIYAFVGLSLTAIPAEMNRVSFLKTLFSFKDYSAVRMIENVMLVLPFFIFLCVKAEWLVGLALLTGSVLLSFLRMNNSFALTLPTPFYKYPFEYTLGFRQLYFLILFAYFLTTMAVVHSNVNLGIFSLLLILLTCLTFYTTPENDFYVWIHSMSPAQFIRHKILISFVYSTILCLPIIITFVINSPVHLKYVAVIYLIGQLYITATLLGKYAFFPSALNLPQLIVMGFSFVFPPLLLLIIPYFYRRSIQQLKPILE
jgi:hypothetical protein